jgi:hypothetical protein
MSLEDKLEKMTAALDRNSAAMEAMMKAAGGKAPAKADAPAAAPAKGDKPKGKKAPTEEELRAQYGEYLKAKDKDEREKRKAVVGKVAEHLGVAKVTEGTDEQRTESMAIVKKLLAGETPDFLEADEDEDGDGDDDSLI